MKLAVKCSCMILVLLEFLWWTGVIVPKGLSSYNDLLAIASLASIPLQVVLSVFLVRKTIEI